MEAWALPLTVDDQRVAISGVVDLVHELLHGVEVVDFKTDPTRHAEAEYRTQVSIYYHVLDAWYPDRDVEVRLFYTADGESVRIDSLSLEAIEGIVREHLRTGRS